MTRPLSCFAVLFTDGSLVDELLDGYSNVLTNSSDGLIGGSCAGGLVLFFVVLYFLYRRWKLHDDRDRVCTSCGRIRIDSRPRYDAGSNAATVFEVCTCMLT